MAASTWMVFILCGFTLLPSSFNSNGFLVRLSLPPFSCQHVEPIRVRLLFTGTVSVNSRSTSWEALPGVLRHEMGLRPPGCPVVVAGSKDVEWRNVGRAIDMIRGVGAEAVMEPKHH
ncbi:MAG TPA: hypothetical protein VGL53_30840 [Bryobacteraceae bacterium]|jgi:biopolymer transport protein ExbD